MKALEWLLTILTIGPIVLEVLPIIICLIAEYTGEEEV